MPFAEPTDSPGELERLASRAMSLANSIGTWSLDELGTPVSLDLTHLTAQQHKILRWFIKEPNEARIAKQLGIRKQSVYNHLCRIQRKLHVNSRAELMKRVLLTLIAQQREHDEVG